MFISEGAEGQIEDVNHSAAHPPSGRRTKKHKQDKNDNKEKAKDAVSGIILSLFIISDMLTKRIV